MKPGELNEPDLVEQIIDEVIRLNTIDDNKGDMVAVTMLATFSIMRQRGLLNDLGIEQVLKSLELYSQRQ